MTCTSYVSSLCAILWLLVNAMVICKFYWHKYTFIKESYLYLPLSNLKKQEIEHLCTAGIKSCLLFRPGSSIQLHQLRLHCTISQEMSVDISRISDLDRFFRPGFLCPAFFSFLKLAWSYWYLLVCNLGADQEKDIAYSLVQLRCRHQFTCFWAILLNYSSNSTSLADRIMTTSSLHSWLMQIRLLLILMMNSYEKTLKTTV